MADPVSWKVLIDKRDELQSILDGVVRQEAVIIASISKSRERQSLMKREIEDVEDSLKSLGWMPERTH